MGYVIYIFSKFEYVLLLIFCTGVFVGQNPDHSYFALCNPLKTYDTLNEDIQVEIHRNIDTPDYKDLSHDHNINESDTSMNGYDDELRSNSTALSIPFNDQVLLCPGTFYYQILS